MTTSLLRTRLLAVLTVAGLVFGLASSASTGSVAEPRISEGVPGRMAIAWSIDVVRPQNGIVPDTLGDVIRQVPRRGDGAIAISDRIIAVADGLDVQLLDPVTGQRQKRIKHGQGHVAKPVIGLWMSGDVLIVETGKIGVITDIWIDGFEYTTGRLLWSTSSLWNHDYQPKVEVSAGVVVRQAQNREGITVLDALAADTGQPLWSKGRICSTGTDYDIIDLAPAGKILAILARCRDSWEIFGIGPTEGSINWRNQLHALTPDTCLNADGPVIMVGSADRFFLFNLAGQALLTRPEKGSLCSIHTTDRGVAMIRNSAIELLDPQGGYIHWKKDLSRIDAAWSSLVGIAGGRIYSTHEPSSDSEILPSFVSSTELSTGDTVVLPLPVKGSPAGSTRNLLVYKTVFSRTIRYTGIRPENGGFPNPVLAGVAPSDWPNACVLLSSTGLNTLVGFTASPEKEKTDIFGVKLPYPTECNYLASDSSDAAFSVTVSWVGGNHSELAAMLESQATEVYPIKAPEKINTDTFIVPYSQNPFSEAFLLYRLYALHVKVPENDHRGDNVKLVRKVVELLSSSTSNSIRKPSSSAPFDIDAASLIIRSFGYEPDLTRPPPPPGPFRAITAICAESADAYCQQVFFFLGQDFVGVGSGEAQDTDHRAIYHVVKITGQDGRTARVEYAVYGPRDANCCPSAQQPQTYRYEDDKLEYKDGAGTWQSAPKEPIEPG
jgi:LppP/LprE lipoprotein